MTTLVAVAVEALYRTALVATEGDAVVCIVDALRATTCAVTTKFDTITIA